jgi:NIMA (never in mitosis gene a)-related kinase 1/4/5
LEKVKGHPSILICIDHFEESGMHFIVTEYCEGGDLKSVIDWHIEEKLDIPEETIYEFTLDILKGLARLHEEEIAHRDIKPTNLMIKNNRIKIGDLGIAISLSSIKRSDHPLKNAGTIQYMSPEVLGELPKDDEKDATPHEIQPKRETDPTRFLKSDIWSCGCVVYEMSTLHKAFFGKNYPEVYEAVINGKVPELEGNRYLRALVHKMLVKSPEQRASAKDLIKIIDELITFKTVTDRHVIDDLLKIDGDLLNEGRFKKVQFLGKQNSSMVVEDKKCGNKRFLIGIFLLLQKFNFV